MHLSNSCPERKIIVCDSFAGFETLHPQLDRIFTADQFKDHSHRQVESLFSERGRSFEVIGGFFSQSCAGRDLGPISFVHLDVDIYKATLESLHFLAERLIGRSMIVLDDYFRRADGVNQAVSEFTEQNRCWLALPLFPSQGLLIHRSWFERFRIAHEAFSRDTALSRRDAIDRGKIGQQGLRPTVTLESGLRRTFSWCLSLKQRQSL